MAAAFVFLIGLFIGSFLNVLAGRLPIGESVLWGRSHCDFCKKTLRWYELIPVFSYSVQRGRCLRCHKRLSVQYPLSEFITGLGLVYLYQSYSYALPVFFSLSLVFSALFVIFLSDFHTQIIPDSMIVVGLIGTLCYYLAQGTFITQLPQSLVWGGLSFFGFYLLWAATRGRGMGFGDVKVSFLLGVFLGFPLVIIALYIAFLTGAIVGVILMMNGKKSWKSKIAFGPFLVFGTITAFVWQGELLLLWHHFL